MKQFKLLRLIGLDAKSAGLVGVMIIAFAAGLIASRFDPGPDWLDPSGFRHADAAIIGLAVGLFAAGCVLALGRWRRRRGQQPGA